MWRPRLAGRFGADIILPDLLVDLVSCDRRRDFSRPSRARFTDPATQSSLAAHLARAPRGISLHHPCFQTLDRTLAVCGAQGRPPLRASMSPNRGSEPPGASLPWPEKSEDWQA
jgi:hypothetical protein